MATFAVPDQYAGKTLRDIYGEVGSRTPFDPGGVGQWAGIDANTPLTAGMTFNAPDDPGSGGVKFLQSSFTPAAQYQQQKAKSQEDEFLGRFRTELPALSQRLEGELNLPNLRKSAFDLTQTLKNIPQTQTQATTGFDVNENQRRRIIAAQQEKIAPLAQEATSQQQFAEAEFGRRMTEGLQPFQAELGLLSDRLAREFTGYQQEQQNELSRYLAEMSRGTQLSLADMQRANQLAIAEQNFERQKELYSFQLAEQQKYKKSSGTIDEWEFA